MQCIIVGASEVSPPLHKAAGGMGLGAFQPDLNVIEVLVKAGGDLNATNKAGVTAIQVAQKSHAKWFRQNQTRFRQILTK
jgi:hypothetical protein